MLTMEKTTNAYPMPNLGCLVGAAYQRMVSDLEKELRKHQLRISASEYLVLRVLYGNDGSQQCDIAAALNKDKAAISRTVETLMRKGLVSIELQSHKCRLVWLTEQAMELKDICLAVAHTRDEALQKLVSPQELEIFRKVLLQITK